MDTRFKKSGTNLSKFKRELILKNIRDASRILKFSSRRTVSDLEDTTTGKTPQSGLTKSRIPARFDMLQKFKQEKKKQKEIQSLSKKPPFIVPVALPIPAVIPDFDRTLMLGKSFKELESTNAGFDFSKAAVFSSGTQFNFQDSVPESLMPRKTSLDTTSESLPVSEPNKTGTSSKSVSFADPEVTRKSFPKTPKTTAKASSSTSKLSTVQIKKSTKTSLGQESTTLSKSASKFSGRSVKPTLKSAGQANIALKSTKPPPTAHPTKPTAHPTKPTVHPPKTTSKSMKSQQTAKAVAFGRCVTVNSSRLAALRNPKPELAQKEIQKSAKTVAPQKQEPVLKGILKPPLLTSGRSKTKTAPKPVTYAPKIQKSTRKSASAAEFTQNLIGTDEDSSPPAQSHSIFKCNVSKIESVDATIQTFEPKSLVSMASSLISYSYTIRSQPVLRKTRTSTPIKDIQNTTKEKSLEDSSSISSVLCEKQNLIPKIESGELLIELNKTQSDHDELQFFTDSFKNIKISEAKKLEIVSGTPASKKKTANKAKETETPKSFSKSLLKQVLEPRRSQRLAEKLRSSSCENLLDVSRPSIMGLADLDTSPASDSAYKCQTARSLSYDFVNLELENTEEAEIPGSSLSSLLFTPPRERKSKGPSVEEDLITFSPMQ